MPRKPLRQCAIKTCPNLVEKDGDIYCKVHKKIEERKYDVKVRNYNKWDRYDSRWKKVRDIYIKQHPLCEECLKENKFIKATVVHHKKTIEEGGDKYDLSNLESLCQSHHMSIHKNLEKTEYKF